MKRFKYNLLGFTVLILVPVLLPAQNTYEDGEIVVSYFTNASAAGLATPDPKARIAVTADGNYGDADDWGATPLTLSIIDHAGYKDKVVHYDYNSKTMSDPKLANNMEHATLEGAERFGFDRSKFFNTQVDPEGAANNLAKEINASTNRNRLVVLLAGSTEMLWQAINRAEPSKRKHVYVLSHAEFARTNNNDIKRKWGHSAVDVIALGVNWLQIADQNKGKKTAETGFATGTMEVWDFIRQTKEGQWVYDWIDRVDSDEGVNRRGYRGATGDASDAGLAFYYFTGDEHGNVTKLKDFYGQSANYSSPQQAIIQTRVFPSEEWLVKDPKDAGLDPDKLDAFVASIGGDGVVIKDGYLIKTWGDPTKHGDWASAAKPCLSTLLFFAVHQKKLSGVDALVAPWVKRRYPGKELTLKDQSMTFRHLANMISGYTRGEAPGTHWAYNDYAINLYASLLTEVFGKSLDHAIRDVLKPLQFQDSTIFGSRKGRGVHASPRDFARIGWFWLNKGNWNNKQLLPVAYFEKYMKADVPADLPVTTTEGVDDLGIGTMGGKSNQTNTGPGVYGFNWWFNNRVPGAEERLMPFLPEDAIMANGHWGKEVMVIIPSWGMVVAGRCFKKEAWGGLGLSKTKTLAEAVINQNILK